MDKNKLHEIKAWWTQIEKLERKGKAIDTVSFADAAHDYIPLLLAELERLSRTNGITRTHERVSLAEERTRGDSSMRS